VKERRKLVQYSMNTHHLSERQACAMLNLSRTVYRYQAKSADDEALRQQLHDLAARKPRWGFPKMFAYLRNRGFRWNHKRVRRV
jgi:putative transposase